MTDKIDFTLVGEPHEPDKERTPFDGLLDELAEHAGELAAIEALEAMTHKLAKLPAPLFRKAAAAASAKLIWSLQSTAAQMEAFKPGFLDKMHAHQDRYEERDGEDFRAFAKIARDALKKKRRGK